MADARHGRGWAAWGGARRGVMALGLGLLLWGGAGCSPSAFLARQLMRAPNRVPEVVKPEGRVVLRWAEGVLERFPAGTNRVGPEGVPLRWVRVEPADYGLTVVETDRGGLGRRARADVEVGVRLPSTGLPAARVAVGTAFVLHGYGVDLECLFPWGLYLAEAGWRVVLVDWRGHGHSGGREVTFGVREMVEVADLRRQLEREGVVGGPYVVVGHSMGAALGLRWQAEDAAIRGTVAMGPYAEFGKAAERLRREYARWVPGMWVRGAVRRLPAMLGVRADGLDTVSAVRGRAVRGLVVASVEDRVTPASDAFELRDVLGPGSAVLLVEAATHETLPYQFERHGAVIVGWLREVAAAGSTSGAGTER